MMNNYEYHLESRLQEGGFALYIFGNNQRFSRDPHYLTFTATQHPQQDERISAEPAMLIRRKDAQKLLQALWDVGLRPNNGESTMAHVQALKEHLADFRAIAAKTLDVTLPNKN